MNWNEHLLLLFWTKQEKRTLNDCTPKLNYKGVQIVSNPTATIIVVVPFLFPSTFRSSSSVIATFLCTAHNILRVFFFFCLLLRCYFHLQRCLDSFSSFLHNRPNKGGHKWDRTMRYERRFKLAPNREEQSRKTKKKRLLSFSSQPF